MLLCFFNFRETNMLYGCKSYGFRSSSPETAMRESLKSRGFSPEEIESLVAGAYLPGYNQRHTPALSSPQGQWSLTSKVRGNQENHVSTLDVSTKRQHSLTSKFRGNQENHVSTVDISPKRRRSLNSKVREWQFF